jgi:hypothetical protein
VREDTSFCEQKEAKKLFKSSAGALAGSLTHAHAQQKKSSWWSM